MYLFRLDDKYRGRAAAIRGKKNERRKKEKKRERMNARQTGVICPGSFVGFVTRPSRYKKENSERGKTRDLLRSSLYSMAGSSIQTAFLSLARE